MSVVGACVAASAAAAVVLVRSDGGDGDGDGDALKGRVAARAGPAGIVSLGRVCFLSIVVATSLWQLLLLPPASIVLDCAAVHVQESVAERS